VWLPQDNVLPTHHFKGEVEMVMNYFRFVAQETREWMARLGVTKLTDLVDRTDLLENFQGETDKQQSLDLMPLLSGGGVTSDKPQFCLDPRNTPSIKASLANE
jgi:glutamate synthase (NADPH) large chain